MRRRPCLLLLTAIALSAAALSARAEEPTNARATLALAVRLPPVHLASYNVTLRQVTITSGAPVSDDEIEVGDGMVTNFTKTWVRPHFVDVTPGIYDLVSVDYVSGRSRYVVCFDKVPSRFVVSGGEAVYLGEFALRPRQSYVDGTVGPPLTHTGDGLAEIQQAFDKERPGASAKLAAIQFATPPEGQALPPPKRCSH
jgi:hypothetical protein